VEVKKGLYVARAVIMCNGLPLCTYLRMGHRNVLPTIVSLVQVYDPR
jgi:hypothetical protein